MIFRLKPNNTSDLLKFTKLKSIHYHSFVMSIKLFAVSCLTLDRLSSSLTQTENRQEEICLTFMPRNYPYLDISIIRTAQQNNSTPKVSYWNMKLQQGSSTGRNLSSAPVQINRKFAQWTSLVTFRVGSGFVMEPSKSGKFGWYWINFVPVYCWKPTYCSNMG